jgi:hypothetical protein
MAGITRGSIIIGNSSGDPAALAIGTNDYVLTSDGTDIAWETAGGNDRDAAAVFNESGADVDFRVESNNDANMLFVDGGNDRVGIGVADPDCTLEIGGTGAMSIPSGTHAQKPSGRNGMMRYDTTVGSGSMYVDGEWHTIRTAVIEALTFEFKKPTTYHITGTLSNSNQVWSATGTYSSVTCSANFTDDFVIICSWQHRYIGAGIAWREDITNAYFTGESGDSNGPYQGSVANSGFNDDDVDWMGGQLGDGPSQDDQITYIMHRRDGDDLTTSYSTNIACINDPDHNSWNVEDSHTIPTSSDHCKIAWGECAGGEVDPLRFIYSDVAVGTVNYD